MTIAGAIFSFALSDPSRTGMPLVVPVASYLLAARHVDQVHDLAAAARYIQEYFASPHGTPWRVGFVLIWAGGLVLAGVAAWLFLDTVRSYRYWWGTQPPAPSPSPPSQQTAPPP